MKGKLVALSLCGLFTLALVTVRLKTRELLLKYEIADLETVEVLLFERCTFLKSEVDRKSDLISLLQRAAEQGIELQWEGLSGESIPFITSTEDALQLE